MFGTYRFEVKNTIKILPILSILNFILLFYCSTIMQSMQISAMQHMEYTNATCATSDFQRKQCLTSIGMSIKTFYNLFIIIFHLCSIILVLKSYRIINFLFFLTESTNIYRYSSILAQSVLSVYRQMKG